MGVQAIKHAALLREWTARFAECRSSGMTVKAWCEAKGLSIKTYYYWEKRVIAQANQETSTSHVPDSHHRLVQPEDHGLGAFGHAEHSAGSDGSPHSDGEIRNTGHHQQRPGKPVHEQGIQGVAERAANPAKHGREIPLGGQHHD